MQRVFFLLIVFVLANEMKAQRPHTGLWATINMPVTFSSHWQWHNDASYRTLGSSVAPLQYLYRPGVRYLFNNKFSIAGGVAFFFSKTDFEKTHHEFGNEFRLWQEALYQQKINKWQLQLRIRSEQRYFAATSIKNKYKAYRYRLKAGVTKMFSNRMGVQLAGEYMRQVKNGQQSFDQNRVQVTALFQKNASTQFQAGYMWLKWPDTNQHLLTIAILKNIKLHERRKANK
jgi:Protein of unknown function (DUF2490)